jgi:hypothetical protein
VCRLEAGSAGVFAERDVPDVMAAIFNSPVVSDRTAERLGVEGDLAGVEGNLLGGVPEAGLGVLVPGQAADARGLDDQAVPLGVEPALLDIEGFDQTVFLTAVALAVDRFEALDRWLVDREVLERGQQGRLGGLDLGEQRVAAVTGCLESFFGSAGRRR